MDYMNTQSMHTKIPLNEKIIIRLPDIEDAQVLESFFFKSIKNNFTYFPHEARTHYSKSWYKETLLLRIETRKDLLYCAWLDDTIIGFVSGTIPEGGIGTIIWLTVDSSYQNKKIGSTLLTYAKEYYRNQNAHKIKLTVHDKRAMNFYLREDFIMEAFHQRHWWQLDFWEMVYFL